jgi:apolipoprotein N-acyltransferase
MVRAPLRQLLLPFALAALAGALSVFAFAPFYLWPLAIVSLSVLFALWQTAPSTKAAGALGFAWGLGLFLAGVSWLYVALHVYGNMPAPLAAVSIFLFCCYLALFPMLAGMLQHKLRAQHQSWHLLIVIPACFVAFEYLRGWFMTGFPWLIMGYVHTPGGAIGSILHGYAPIIGVFGLSWLTALTAAIGLLLLRAPLRFRVIVGAAIVVVWTGGILLAQLEWSKPSGASLTVSLLQGNIDQAQKWREETLDATMKDYLALANLSRAKLIVMPETAIPRWLHQIPEDYLAQLKSRAVRNGGDLILGAPMVQLETKQYFNSAISMGVSPSQTYSKSHLVAFGEFIPPLFSWAYRWLDIPLAGFTPGAEKQASMRLSGHRVALNICYEDTFGHEIARPLPDAELLINISNMAWYGRSLAAEQHLQFSQMRSLETSRWMLRATNTGLTAAVNERGEIVKALPQFTRGILDVEAVPRQGVTPYTRWKDAPVLIGLLIALAAGVVFRKSASRE